MSNSVIPSQFGYTAPNSTNGSQIYLGKNVGVQFEAVGLGQGGRPDVLNAVKIHISKDGVAQGAIYINVEDVLTLKAANSNLTGEVFLKLKEVAVCEEIDGVSTEKRMVILGSETYAAAS